MVYKLVLDKKYIDKTIYYNEDNTIPYYFEGYIDEDLESISFYDQSINEYIDYILHSFKSNYFKGYLLLKNLYQNKDKEILCITDNPNKSFDKDLVMAASTNDSFTVSDITSGNLIMTFTVWDKTDNEPFNELGDYTRINTQLCMDGNSVEPTHTPNATGRNGIWRQEITAAEYLDVDSIMVSGEYEGYSYDTYEYQDYDNIEILSTRLILKNGTEKLVDDIIDATFTDSEKQNDVRDALMSFFKYHIYGSAVVAENEQQFQYKNVSIHTNFFESRSNSIKRNDKEDN